MVGEPNEENSIRGRNGVSYYWKYW